MNDTTPTRPGLSLRRAAPLLLLSAGALFGAIMLGDQLSFGALRDNREWLLGWRDRNFGLAAFGYVAVYVAVVAFSIPGALVMSVAGGFLFGLIGGALLTVLAATTGAALVFSAARAGLGDALRERMLARGAAGPFARIERGLKENEVSYLLLMRLVPAVPFFVANLAPAFFGVSLRRFVATTFLGILPGTLAITWIGVGVGAVFDRGETPDLGLLVDPAILGPLLGICALAGLPIAIKAMRRRQSL